MSVSLARAIAVLAGHKPVLTWIRMVLYSRSVQLMILNALLFVNVRMALMVEIVRSLEAVTSLC